MALTPAELAELRRLVAAHAKSRTAVTRTAVTAARREVRGFTSWYETAAIAVLAARLAEQAESSQRLTAALTDTYLARVLTIMRGRPVTPAGTVKVQGLRAGVTHPGVYGRLADQYRYDTSRGVDDVLDRVLDRVEVLTSTDNDLAFRAQVRHSLSDLKITGYRRVIHPELSAGGTCGLCIAASDRIYKKAELLPLHDRCRCGVLPVLAGDDPADVLNGEDLAALYKAAGSTSAADLKRTRVRVDDHGELGPVLRDAAHRFRGQDDLSHRRPDRARDVDAGRTVTQLQAALASLEAATVKSPATLARIAELKRKIAARR